MNQNTVQNPQTEVPQTKEMNDRDILGDLLGTEKSMVNHYSYALNEASNDTLQQQIMGLFNETCQAQRELFNLMFAKGWYSLEKAEQTKITQKYNQFSTDLNNLPQ